MTTCKEAPEAEPFYFIYTTLPDQPTALQLARDIIQKRLAACVNILGNIHTVYEDEGHVCEGNEVALLIKTTLKAHDAALDFVKKQHPYHTPAVLSWHALCNASFGLWMKQQLCEIP